MKREDIEFIQATAKWLRGNTAYNTQSRTATANELEEIARREIEQPGVVSVPVLGKVNGG